MAARHGHAEMVTALLDGGANPSIATHGGFTPLHYAAESGHAEVIARLLGGGADPKARTADMFTAIHLAAQYANDPEIMAACTDRTIPLATPARTWPSTMRTPLFEDRAPAPAEMPRVPHLQQLASPRLSHLGGLARTMPVCACGCAVAAAGGTPDGRNRTNGKTAMHYAAQRGSVAHVVMLLRLGAHIPCNDARLVPPAVPNEIRVMLDAAGDFWSLAAHRTTALGAVCFDALSTVLLSVSRCLRAGLALRPAHVRRGSAESSSALPACPRHFGMDIQANCAHRAQGEMAAVLPPEMWELIFSYGRVLEWDGRQRSASNAAAQDLFD